MTREEREQALEWFKNRPITMSGAKKMYDLAIAALEQLEPCEDAVSREALRKAMYHRAFETDGDTMWQSGYWIRYRAAEQVIKESPSVTPERKTGKWIPVKNGRGGHECDQCHNYAPAYQTGEEHLTDFCPNCGAKMEETECN